MNHMGEGGADTLHDAEKNSGSTESSLNYYIRCFATQSIEVVDSEHE